MAQDKPKLPIKGSKKCYVCDLDSIGTNKFKQHMEDHSEDLKKYKFSNNLLDSCKTACKLCGKQFRFNAMRAHTKKEHGMPITEYKAKFNQFFYDIVEKVFHR